MFVKIIYLYSCLSQTANVATLITVIDSHTKPLVGEPLLPLAKKLKTINAFEDMEAGLN